MFINVYNFFCSSNVRSFIKPQLQCISQNSSQTVWHIVKHGLDPICKTWIGFVKHGRRHFILQLERIKFIKVTETTFTIFVAHLLFQFVNFHTKMIDRQTKCIWTMGIDLNPQKMQKNKQKKQAEENYLQRRLGTKQRFLRVIQPVMYPHKGNQSDFLYYRTVNDNFIEKV